MAWITIMAEHWAYLVLYIHKHISIWDLDTVKRATEKWEHWKNFTAYMKMELFTYNCY